MKTYVHRYVFIDNCVTNRLAQANIDPVKVLKNSEFQVAFTPDLEFEYRQGLAHPTVAPQVKTLLQSLLDHGARHGFFGFDDAPRGAIPPPIRKRTDAYLVALSQTEIVITADNKPPWDRAIHNPGLVTWSDLQLGLQAGLTLVEFLRSKAAVKNRA